MRLTTDEFLQLQARIEARRRKKPDSNDPGGDPKPQPVVRDESLGAGQGKARNPTRLRVCVTRRSVRLLDEDNICEKYAVDCLRYAGALRDDAPEFVRIEARQEKVESQSDECTVIEITELV